MKKYLVDIFLPSIGQHYDAIIPSEKQISEAVLLLSRMAEALSGGDYRQTPDAILMWANNGSPLSPELTVQESGIRNGSHLMLV